MLMRFLKISLIVFGVAWVAGCDESPSIPDDVSFYVINEYSDSSGIKRSVEVQLNKKVSEDTLRAIALKIKSQDSKSYDRTFITHYLPEMTVGAGAWATTHFNPELAVDILGFTVEDEHKFRNEEHPPSREIVGRWLDEGPFPSYIEIYIEREKLFVRQKFKNSGEQKLEVIENKTPNGRRFSPVESSSSDDHWIVTSTGDLQIRDKDGLIGTAIELE